jgi:excisionase family DNA binding protein
MNPRSSHAYLSIRQTAARLNLPVDWLRAEADAGRLPHLRVGRRRLFNLRAVEEALISRSALRKEADHG